MKKIEPPYVTFEQSVKLKEKGFDVEVNSEILTNGFVNHHGIKKNWNFEQGFYSAPEQWQIIEWLWETYLIDVTVIPIRFRGERSVSFQYRVINFSDPEVDEVIFEHQYQRCFEQYTSRSAAYSAAFDYILNNIL